MSSIPKDITEFIESHSPFDILEEPYKNMICNNIGVEFYPKNSEVSFSDRKKQYAYIIKKGVVEIKEKQGDQFSILDFCTEGEVFGFRPLFSEGPRHMIAFMHDDTLLYCIPLEILEQKIIKQVPEFGDHCKAFFSEKSARIKNVYNQIQRIHQKSDNSMMVTRDIAKLRARKNILTCTLETTIREAASLMKEKHVGSIVIVDKNKRPLGIITNQDFRSYIAQDSAINVDEKVSHIMSTPVRTISDTEHVIIECLLEMLDKKCHHLCVTLDGTVHSEVVGMISKHDLMLAQGETPEVILREIKYNSPNVEELSQLRKKAEEIMIWYLQKNIHTYFVTSLMTTINDAITRKCIEFALEDLPKPPVSFSWLSIGSQGRGEQVLTTDQDNMLVYQDTKDPEVKSYFLDFAASVNQKLREVGFAYDVADILAKNEKWCQPLSIWKQYFTRWIEVPKPKSVMHCTIFFDYRHIYGDESLVKSLDQHLAYKIKSKENFFGFLMKNALENPAPLGIFNQFLIEKKGSHSKEFDLKLRAIMPLVDAARVLILSKNVFDIKNTLDRYKKLQSIDPENKTLYENAIEAYKLFIKYRSLMGAQNRNSGRYISPDELSTLQKRLLKDAFKTIAALQDLLKFKFRKYTLLLK